MNGRTHRDPLTEDLSQLPRVQVSDGFADKVLTALDERASTSSPTVVRFAWAAAAGFVLALLIGLGIIYQRQRAAEIAYRHQVEELRSRYEELLDEVVSIRREASGPDSRLYLGGDESLDLMLDLNQLNAYPQAGRQDSAEVRPASWEQ